MRQEVASNAIVDRLAKEQVQKLNTADSMISQTDKQLKEYGDELSADNKSAIEGALAELWAAHSNKDVVAIDNCYQ